MTRRITRTLGQLVAFLVVLSVLLFFADSRYRVLPNAIHSHLPSHHVGTVITDITVTFCSAANPFSSCTLDPDEWHRIPKDLYLHSGWFQTAWMHVKRKREEELTADDWVVIDVRVGALDPGVSEKGKQAERWESRPAGIWIQRSSAKQESDSKRVVTAVDLLFGADAVDPRPNWELARTPLVMDVGTRSATPRLSVRHGPPKLEKKDLVPRVRKDGRFKILQISDAHLSTGVGKCRDAIGADGRPSSHCEADPRTLDFLESVLDDEKPDFVVLTGDQVEGPAAIDTQSALFKMVAPLIEREIPYAAIFGNHDDEGDFSLSRDTQMALMQTLPLSMSEPGPAEVAGVGNYYIEVLGASPSQNSAITIYMLDSHSFTPDEKNYKGYDWLKPSQIDWFRKTAQSLKKAHAKYSHIHMDLAFIHIPLPEYGEKDNTIKGGKFKEPITAPTFNSHFYDALADEGIVALGCGHDHVNDYCALRSAKAATAPRDDLATPADQTHHQSTHGKKHSRGPWMCYAGGSGFGGYAGYGGYHRRVRVWEVDTGASRLTTWKRVECCGDDTKKKIDELVVVEGGVVTDGS